MSEAALPADSNAPSPVHFIESIIIEDRKKGKNGGRVATRFPPEPNGYLHIGHAKSIVLNFGLAAKYRGPCNLRFDDTNPVKEDIEFVESIKRDVNWLGYEWSGLFFASDYFDKLYQYAIDLIKAGKAYVCDLDAEQVRQYRGTLTSPGKESPSRNRTVEENLDLFGRMKSGEFPDGSKTLRAKIDMSSGNINLRDPALYRIRRAVHHRTGDTWCIYPLYDFTHGLSDAIEGITHSICTLEFEDHRPLYDWFLDQVETAHRPQQIEFARLNLSHTLMSKRLLAQLVKDGHVDGWNDPRMPTIAGLRRRGCPPEAIRAFCERIGVSKANSMVDVGLLEFFVREHLNRVAPRRMAVLRPLKVILTNYPADQVEEFDAENIPENTEAGSRKLPFSKELWIESEDFMEEPPRKWFRLSPGAEIRLKHAYYIRCEEVIKNESGEVVELRCSYDPQSRGGWTQDGRKVKGTSHWVSAAHAVDAEVRLYAHLFEAENPAEQLETTPLTQALNASSLEVLRGCKLEGHLAEAPTGQPFQFLRQGYFCADEKYSRPEAPVFNLTVNLKDTWAKTEKKFST